MLSFDSLVIGTNGYEETARSELGAQGIEKIIQLDLTESEQAALSKSADAVKELIAVMSL